MKLICLLLFILAINVTFSQGIKISENGSNPDATAILELESENKGFLPPRLTIAQRDAITSPAEGLVIYNIDTKCINFYNATAWIDLCGSVSTPPSGFSCGDTFEDVRDGQTYATVQIGNQCWMAENLNYNASGSFCYADDPNNCNTFGRLYSWSVTMGGAGSSNTNPSGVQGVCPEGWHVPSDAEWQEIEVHLGMNTLDLNASGATFRNSGNVGQQLKATTFGGNNSSGFNAIGSGKRQLLAPEPAPPGHPFYDLNANAYFWTSSVDSSSRPFQRMLQNNENGVNRNSIPSGLADYSVRCVRD